MPMPTLPLLSIVIRSENPAPVLKKNEYLLLGASAVPRLDKNHLSVPPWEKAIWAILLASALMPWVVVVPVVDMSNLLDGLAVPMPTLPVLVLLMLVPVVVHCCA